MLVSTHIERVADLYRIHPRDEVEVTQFLADHPQIASVLVEAVPHIHIEFKNVIETTLQVEHDPEGDYDELFGVIKVAMGLDEMMDMLDRFDTVWFSHMPTDVHLMLNFTVESVDE